MMWEPVPPARLIIATSVTLLLLLGYALLPELYLKYAGSSSPEAIPRHPASVRGLITATGTSMLVYQPNQLTLQTRENAGEIPSELTLEVTDLAWHQSISAKDLTAGVQVTVVPEQVGTFTLAVRGAGLLLDEVPVFVSFPQELGPETKVRYDLCAGPWTIDKDRITVPVYAILTQARGSVSVKYVPIRATKTTDIIIQERDNRLPPTLVTIRKGMVVSEPFYVAVIPRSKYHFAAVPDSGPPGPELPIGWESQAPAIGIVASPVYQTAVASPLTPARLLAYVSVDGQRLKPNSPVALSISVPGRVHVLSGNDQTIDPASGFARIEVVAASSVPGAAIRIKEATFGTMATTIVDFNFPWLLLATSAVGGLVGAVVSRGRRLLHQSWKSLAIDLVISAAAAVLLWGSILLGWLPLPDGSALLVGEAPALIVGLLGGFLGQAVFWLLARTWQLVRLPA